MSSNPNPAIWLTAFLVSNLASKAFEGSNSKVLSETTTRQLDALRDLLIKKIEKDRKAKTALLQIEKSGEPSSQSLEIINETLEEKISEDPDFAEKAQESQGIIIENLESENSEFAQEYITRIQALSEQINQLQDNIINAVKQQININIEQGDYLGKDSVLLSGNSQIIVEHGRSRFENQEYDRFLRFLTQTEQIKGKITQFFTVKRSMDELDRIRQPRPILTDYVEQELEFYVPLPLSFGNISLRRLSRKQNKNNSTDEAGNSASAEAYFKKIKDIEVKVGAGAEQDKLLSQSLSGIAEEINLNISRLNNSFILALYPALSSKELVANMVSKIGYKELREESEMHLSVIQKLVDKLNDLMENLGVDRLEKKGKSESEILVNQNDDVFLIQSIAGRLKNRKDEEVKIALMLIKNLLTDSDDKKTIISDNQDGRNIYVLSDKAQAALGMMIDIEKRRSLVEDLVRADRQQRNRTTQLVTLAIILIICFMILGGFIYGPLVTVGTKSLDDLKLPLLNIPWPVVFWSFIGSFAAMIYRFNRQPIHEFGDVIKWTLTRLVQGVVLGSAFYLILVSGLSLLAGVTPADSAGSTSNKITTEVILILSFLVGFSDRFADSVFNTLIEKYSQTAENASSKKSSKTDSEN